MDLTRYLPQTADTNGTDTPPGPGGEGRDEGHASSSAPTSASGQGVSDGHGGGLTRSLSLTERTRLNLSHTWYSIADYLGLQRLKAIMSGMNTLPETTEPLYLLGKRYESLNKGENSGEFDHSVEARREIFAADVASRSCITYRSGFSPLGEAFLTTDAGWGCTIRSGQMLLANCLLVHLKGRDWRRQGKAPEGSGPGGGGGGGGGGGSARGEERTRGGGNGVTERDVVSLFHDSPSSRHYLSIHNIVRHGACFGIVPGHWVGPYVLSQTFDKIINGNDHSSLALYLVAEAGGIPTLYRSRASAQAQEGDPKDGPEALFWKPLLILIPMTLGITASINPVYVPQILTMLSMPQTVGVVGGKLGSSVYLIGRQGKQVLYLDPHSLKPFEEDGKVNADSYFASEIHHMAASKLDPSLALGFYCRTRRDFDALYDQLRALAERYPTASLLSVAEEPAAPIPLGFAEESRSEDGFEVM